MIPEIQTVVRATQAWLQSSWHVQVPFAWLTACVEWVQEEAGEARRLSQQQINQQVLDQWLLTDLRDLDHPVLPEGLAEAQKTELRGIFCVQVDSLLDISQPAYGQLQKWRGSDCANDEVSAVTQTTQRPWEAKPTRVLLLQVTDGVQSLEAMEYQPIPALSTALRPGAKLQLQGQMVCRLGMLLLGPANIKVLGGEVEDLVERNTQGRVLCRTLGLPQEQQQQQQEQDVSAAPQQVNQDDDDLELNEAELVANLEAHEDVHSVQVRSVGDSGYRTLSETSARSSSVRSFVSTTSSRSEAPTRSYRSDSTQSTGYGSIREDSEVQAHHMAEEDFPEEDFDDLPLDELDSVIFQQTTNVSEQPDSTTNPQTTQFEKRASNCCGSRFGSNSRSVTPKQDFSGCTNGATGQLAAAASTPPFFPAAVEPPRELEFASKDETDFMDVDMDCFLDEVETCKVQPGATGGTDPVQQGPRRDSANTTQAGSSGSSSTCNSGSSKSIGDRFLAEFESSRRTSQGQTLITADSDRASAQKNPQSDGSVPALTLTSPPFTYLCLLEDPKNQPPPRTTEIRVKAFIVTLLGKLSSNNNVWSVSATISDGTGYLDVELSNEVLTGLLGFSVADKASMKRDPARRGELDAGMKRCQEELVDMCCVMTVMVEPDGRKAVVTKADQVSEKVLRELEARVRDRRK